MKAIKKIRKIGKVKFSKVIIASEVYTGWYGKPCVDCVHTKTGKRFWWYASSSIDESIFTIPAEMPKRQRLPWHYKRK